MSMHELAPMVSFTLPEASPQLWWKGATRPCSAKRTAPAPIHSSMISVPEGLERRESNVTAMGACQDSPAAV